MVFRQDEVQAISVHDRNIVIELVRQLHALHARCTTVYCWEGVKRIFFRATKWIQLKIELCINSSEYTNIYFCEAIHLSSAHMLLYRHLRTFKAIKWLNFDRQTKWYGHRQQTFVSPQSRWAYWFGELGKLVLGAPSELDHRPWHSPSLDHCCQWWGLP